MGVRRSGLGGGAERVQAHAVCLQSGRQERDQEDPAAARGRGARGWARRGRGGAARESGAAPAQGARAGSGEGGPLASLSPHVLPAVEALREIFSAQLAEQLAEQTSRLESRLAALERLLAKQKMRPR